MRVVVGAVTNVDLPLHDLLAVLAEEAASGVIDATMEACNDRLENNAQSCAQRPFNSDEFDANASLSGGQPDVFKKFQGKAYESLCNFMQDLEKKYEPSCCRLMCVPGKPQLPPCKDWRRSMKLTENRLGRKAWVLNENADKYEATGSE